MDFINIEQISNILAFPAGVKNSSQLTRVHALRNIFSCTWNGPVEKSLREFPIFQPEFGNGEYFILFSVF